MLEHVTPMFGVLWSEMALQIFARLRLRQAVTKKKQRDSPIRAPK